MYQSETEELTGNAKNSLSGEVVVSDSVTRPTPMVRIRGAVERGMATAEYAVGILAAVAIALVLLKIVTNQSFFGSMLKVVTSIIGKISGMLP